ncbi:MAG: hypothetical protein V2I97_11605, partial [Desulfococcaceae bacterium]|nr:hypothetical protein [Desulfococcaceae bacterium]
QLITNILGTFRKSGFRWKSVLSKSENLSHSDIVLACNDAVKKAILSDQNKVTDAELGAMLDNRHNIHKGLSGN